ncbi:unnamed protein product [Timema podura]|uniref:CHK kinase-like domain-containing protein n=1 Tax=Timema podura TaxID=61482 RepID=A0ABN7NLA0_TIMPD|nr:unnamed protein product [Timema podura]
MVNLHLSNYPFSASDLKYFFYSSLRVEEWNKIDLLLEHYHQALGDKKKELGLDPGVYTMKDLKQDMEEKLPYTLTTLVTHGVFYDIPPPLKTHLISAIEFSVQSPTGTMDTGKELVSQPEWLTAEFLQELIRREDHDPNISVILTDVNFATSKGDNYLSVIYRVDIECTSRDKTQTSTLIVKCPPLDKLLEKFGEDVGSFDREIFMYRDVIPKLYSIWKERTGHPLSKILSPRGYPSSRTDTLILEDLRPRGYKMADRRSQLDLDHTCLVLRALAKLHAMSLAMLEEDPSSFKHLDEHFFTVENKDMISHTYIKPVKASVLLLRQCPEFEHLADRLEEMYATFIDDLIKTVKSDDTPLSVLNHGDCWVNNILFKYSPDTGIVEDIRFLDFQISRFSSPVLDLHYFLYSSVRYDVLKDIGALLAEYYNALIKNLQQLGCGRLSYSLEDLKRDFRKKLWFGYITLSTVRVGVMLDPESVPNKAYFVDKTAGPELILKKWYSKSYKEFFKKIVADFEKEGFFEK